MALVSVCRGSIVMIRPPRAASALALSSEVGHAPHAPVRDHRVRADHHEQIRPVDVGDRDGIAVAEHAPDRHVLRHLVERRRREHVGRPERRSEFLDVEDEAGSVDDRVADDETGRQRTRRFADRQQSAFDLGECFVEGGLDELAVALDQGPAEAVGVVLQVFEGGAFRAQESVTRHVVAVAADQRDIAVLDGDLEATGRLAQRAHVQVLRRVSHGLVAGS